MKSFLPWVGGKSKLLWLIHRLSPARYDRFVDVFGGSGTVTLNHPHKIAVTESFDMPNIRPVARVPVQSMASLTGKR